MFIYYGPIMVNNGQVWFIMSKYGKYSQIK